MNEVVQVYDACVAEPPQGDMDVDVFRAWSMGLTVNELVTSLQSSLLSQYELTAGAAGSGYAALQQNSQQAAAIAAANALAQEEAAEDAAEDGIEEQQQQQLVFSTHDNTIT